MFTGFLCNLEFPKGRIIKLKESFLLCFYTKKKIIFFKKILFQEILDLYYFHRTFSLLKKSNSHLFFKTYKWDL